MGGDPLGAAISRSRRESPVTGRKQTVDLSRGNILDRGRLSAPHIARPFVRSLKLGPAPNRLRLAPLTDNQGQILGQVLGEGITSSNPKTARGSASLRRNMFAPSSIALPIRNSSSRSAASRSFSIGLSFSARCALVSAF